MSSLAFSFIIFSALAHAVWNLLVKQSRDKTVFIWWMFLGSGSLLNLVVWLSPARLPSVSGRILLLALASGVCFVCYHLFTGRAYRDGDLSMTYPLAQTAMFYVPLWGMLFLGERLSAIGLGGILLVALGAYTVQLRSLAAREFFRPLQNLGSPSVQAALAAGFCYSVGAVIDKIGVSEYPPLFFTYLLVMVMFLLFSLNLLRPRYRGRVLREWGFNNRLILCSGPVMLVSFLSFRFGLQLAPMSYAVPLRQVSLLAGVLIGLFFLGEGCGRIRFCAASLILAGVCLLRFS